MAWLTDEELFQEFFLSNEDREDLEDNFKELFVRVNDDRISLAQEVPRVDLDSYCQEMIMSPVGSKKRFSKPFSANHRYWISQLAFTYSVGNSGFIRVFNIRFKVFRSGGVSFDYELLPVSLSKTPRGNVYTWSTDTQTGGKMSLAFTSHFIERYMERTGRPVKWDGKGRLEVLFDYIRDLKDRKAIAVLDNSSRIVTPEGVGIGNCLRSQNMHYIVMYTFVSRKMLTKKQEAVLSRNLIEELPML